MLVRQWPALMENAAEWTGRGYRKTVPTDVRAALHISLGNLARLSGLEKDLLGFPVSRSAEDDGGRNGR